MYLFKNRKENASSSKCSQCTNQAMCQFEGHLLCLSCYKIVHEIEQQKLHNLFIMHNRTAASMENALGMTNIVPRYSVPTPNIFNGDINDIRINNSSVGSVNTGRIENLNLTMKHINIPKSEDILPRVKEFVEALLASQMADTTKNEIMEQIDTILTEVSASPEKKKSSVIRTLMNNVRDSLDVGNGLFEMWENIQETINNLL